MIETILLGLSALSSVTGFSSGTFYDNQAEDFINIAEFIGAEIKNSDEDKTTIEGVLYYDDLYNLAGENRYLELCLKNGGYVIYDKKESTIDEYSFSQVSPYHGYKDYFKIYNEEIFDFKYALYKNDNFIDLSGKSMLAVNTISDYYDTLESTAGNYYRDVMPGPNAHVISNAFYFQKLKSRHAGNSKGTCAIVSLEILLGYYDTFYNDNFVDEFYDVPTEEYTSNNYLLSEFNQSPGVDDYDTSDHDFHDYLVGIAKNEIDDDPEVDGMTGAGQIRLTNNYLKKRGISYSPHTAEGNLADIIGSRAISFIKTAIDANRPVIANGSGHSVVAYAYDKDFVYVHSGWGYFGSTPWSTYGTTLNSSAGCIDIEFKGEHLHSNNYISTNKDISICPCGTLHQKTTITPADYGFEPQYFFYEKQKSFVSNGLNVHTNRLRTGYIENEYINLSPRRTGAGKAYLEYHFGISVERLSFNISFWSSAEGLTTSDSSAYFQIRDSSGNWSTEIDLLSKSLSKNRYAQDKFSFNFGNREVYAIRFISQSSAVGDNNKGRISIGDMEILYNY